MWSWVYHGFMRDTTQNRMRGSELRIRPLKAVIQKEADLAARVRKIGLAGSIVVEQVKNGSVQPCAKSRGQAEFHARSRIGTSFDEVRGRRAARVGWRQRGRRNGGKGFQDITTVD